MGYVDIAIPLVAGVLLAFGPPGLFTKATGDRLAQTTVKLRRIGWLLIGVAGLYLTIRLASG